MVGPPVAGKSMPDLWLAGVLTLLNPAEAIEDTMLNSVAGNLTERIFIQNRLLYEPHHSTLIAARQARSQVKFPL